MAATKCSDCGMDVMGKRAYEPWRCKHDKPLDVLQLVEESPRVEWCMECGCARKEELAEPATATDWQPRYAWGEWMRPASLGRWKSTGGR
jgi:hypothetical protein